MAAPIGVEGNAFVASKFANKTWPDIQLAFVSAHPGFDGGTVYKDFLGFSENVSCNISERLHWRKNDSNKLTLIRKYNFFSSYF